MVQREELEYGKSREIMDGERSRTGRKRRIGALGLAAAAGCCLATTASASAGPAASDVVVARVTPGNAGRNALEGRRRLQREYYRGLYEASSSAGGGGVSGRRAGRTSVNDEAGRRLGSMHHKKSSEGDCRFTARRQLRPICPNERFQFCSNFIFAELLVHLQNGLH